MLENTIRNAKQIKLPVPMACKPSVNCTPSIDPKPGDFFYLCTYWNKCPAFTPNKQ